MGNLQFAFRTDQGGVVGKGDSAYLEANNLFVVMEGPGGDYLDGIAIETTSKALHDTFFSSLREQPVPTDALTLSLWEANRELLREGGRIGKRIGVSLAAVYVADTLLYFTHLGDARVTCLQKGKILRLTRDPAASQGGHSLSPSGEKERGNGGGRANALGMSETPAFEVKTFALRETDRILITAGRFNRCLSDMQLLKASEKTHGIGDLADRLVAEGRRVEREQKLTLGLIGYEKNPRKSRVWFLVGLILFLLVLGAAFFLRS